MCERMFSHGPQVSLSQPAIATEWSTINIKYEIQLSEALLSCLFPVPYLRTTQPLSHTTHTHTHHHTPPPTTTHHHTPPHTTTHHHTPPHTTPQRPVFVARKGEQGGGSARDRVGRGWFKLITHVKIKCFKTLPPSIC